MKLLKPDYVRFFVGFFIITLSLSNGKRSRRTREAGNFVLMLNHNNEKSTNKKNFMKLIKLYSVLIIKTVKRKKKPKFRKTKKFNKLYLVLYSFVLLCACLIIYLHVLHTTLSLFEISF